MRHRHYLALFLLMAVLGGSALYLTLHRLDPFLSPSLALPFFFASLFFFLSGVFALLGFYARVYLRAGEIYSLHLTIALRQGILMTLAVSSCLGLQMMDILTWWVGLLVCVAFALIELYYMSRD